MGEEKGDFRTFLPALPKIATRGGVRNTIIRICFRNHNLAGKQHPATSCIAGSGRPEPESNHFLDCLTHSSCRTESKGRLWSFREVTMLGSGSGSGWRQFRQALFLHLIQRESHRARHGCSTTWGLSRKHLSKLDRIWHNNFICLWYDKKKGRRKMKRKHSSFLPKQKRKQKSQV